MPQHEHERELKNTLTPEEYQKICIFFNVHLGINSKTQRNHYFDTKEYFLNEADYTLRAREKTTEWEFSFKEKPPKGVGRLETTHKPLTDAERENLFNKSEIPLGPVKTRLDRFSLNEDNPRFMNHGVQETQRIVIKNDHGEFMLDYTTYFGVIDHEIEFEMDDSITDEAGEEYFCDFLKSLHIERKPAESKRELFFKRKKEMLQRK